MRIAIALITSAVLAGCIGGITEVGGGGDQPDAGTRGPDATTIDLKAVFRQWSGCMTLTNFQTANMATAWSQLTTSDNKQCQNCHDQGQYNFIATDDEAAFFAGITQHSSLMAMYFRVDAATMKVEINTASFASANAKTGHPRFNTMSNIGMTALTTFHTATAANTACEAPKMLD
ncbi:MAG TPA: hypothetical protein VIV11_21735 [Kofleriaceae bacterium]